MMKVLFLMLVIIFVTPLQPGAKIAVNTSIYEDVIKIILPKLDKKYANVTLENYTRKIPLFEVNFTNNSLQLSSMDPSQVSYMFKNASSKVSVKVFAIEANVTIFASYDMAGLKDHLKCEAYMKYVYIDSEITSSVTPTGLPYVLAKAKLHLDPSKAELVFTGGFTSKVLELMEPIVKYFIAESVDISINRNLHKVIEDEINTIINTFTVDMPINSYINVSYDLSSASFYYDDALSTPLTGFIYYTGHKVAPTYNPPAIPDWDLGSKFNVQFFLSEYLLNSGLLAAWNHDLFTYGFDYDLIDPIYMKLHCNATEVPKLFIDKDVKTNLTFYCNISALNRSDYTFTDFNAYGKLEYDLSFYFNNKAIEFTIHKVHIMDLKFIKPQDYDVQWFIDGSQELADFVSNYIDYSFLANGIPLPDIKFLKYNRVYSKIFPQNIGLFTNISLPS